MIHAGVDGLLEECHGESGMHSHARAWERGMSTEGQDVNADLLRWPSSPKPRFVLPPMGGKLRLHRYVVQSIVKQKPVQIWEVAHEQKEDR